MLLLKCEVLLLLVTIPSMLAECVLYLCGITFSLVSSDFPLPTFSRPLPAGQTASQHELRRDEAGVPVPAVSVPEQHGGAAGTGPSGGSGWRRQAAGGQHQRLDQGTPAGLRALGQ